MARREARLKTRIWDDNDFLELPGPEQLAYIFAISQPDISHVGVIPLRLKRWAKKLKYRTDQLEKVLANLENTRFFVVDYEEEELLVRSFLRNDEVYKQPKVLLAADRQLAEISSPKLRAHVAIEVQRVLDEGLAGDNTRPTLLKMLGTLGRVSAIGVNTQVNTLSDTHSATPSEGYREGVPEGHPIPDAMGTGVGVGVEEGFKEVVTSSSSPSEDPADHTSDEAHTNASEGNREKANKTTSKPAAKRGTRIADDFAVTEDLRDWAKRKAPLAFAELDYQTEQFVDYWRGRTGQIAIKLDWPATWQWWMRKANKELAERAQRRSNPQGAPSAAPKLLTESEKCEEHRRALPCGLCKSEQIGRTQHAA